MSTASVVAKVTRDTNIKFYNENLPLLQGQNWVQVTPVTLTPANGSIPTLIQCLVGAMALLDFHGKRQKIVWLKQCRRSCL